MDLISVEKLKSRTNLLAFQFVDLQQEVPNFAVGVGMTDDPNEFQLAIRLTKESDRERVEARFGELWQNADVEIRVVGTIVAQPSEDAPMTANDEELAIGMSISHIEGEAGTLGFFAERHGVRGFVSCNHVVARVDAFQRGDEILSPAKKHGGVSPKDLAGTIEKVATLRHFFRKRADAAFVRASPHRFPTIPGRVPDGRLRNDLVFIERSMPVIKVGQTTGRREGRVRTRNMDRFVVEYPSTQFNRPLKAMFDDVYEIETTEKDGDGEFKTFCQDGDSGAVVYTPSLQPVGLLFSRSSADGPDNTGFGYMNLLSGVLNALDARLIV
ncbi:MAG TPA: hypothetical protein VN181_07775 [Thermoanaerobaculia bacterium]|nr:hypothetical protein [Thermoanaerobaculia bacterium]